MKREYLIIINTKQFFCCNKKTFENLIRSDERIKIENNKIFFNDFEVNYKNQTNKLANDSEYTYFHLILDKNEDIEDNMESLDKFDELSRAIRQILGKIGAKVEVLWDDIGMYYSEKAYPMIYKVENLMRKLLTKFMLINVGLGWESDRVPSKISNSKNKNKNSDENKSLLYKLDFIELATFLFEEYSTVKANEIKKIIQGNENIDKKQLEGLIPKSNWERYFDKIVNAEDAHLSKKWDELYKLRCKIAHNNLLNKKEYCDIERIVNDIQPSIEKAIEELDEIKVEEDQKISLTESYVVKKVFPLQQFLKAYEELFDLASEVIKEKNININIRGKNDIRILNELKEKNIITMEQYTTFRQIQYNRNNWVHMVGSEPTNSEIEKAYNSILNLQITFRDILKREGDNVNEDN